VEISPAGWVPGQKVFLFLGRRFLLVSSPGASIVIDAAGSAGATLSGFQFPSDNPAAPVDGYASASVPGTVG
jgi:gamma-glutamyltranspeptidase